MNVIKEEDVMEEIIYKGGICNTAVDFICVERKHDHFWE